MNYPQYISHKKVSAVKIEKIDPGADGSLTLHLEGGFDNVVIPHHDVRHKPTPSEGWYLVVYEGGYVSFSPAQAFEEGYTLVELVEQPAVGAIATASSDAAQQTNTGTAVIEDDDDDDDEDEDDPEVMDAMNNHGQAAALEQSEAAAEDEHRDQKADPQPVGAAD